MAFNFIRKLNMLLHALYGKTISSGYDIQARWRRLQELFIGLQTHGKKRYQIMNDWLLAS